MVFFSCIHAVPVIRVARSLRKGDRGPQTLAINTLLTYLQVTAVKYLQVTILKHSSTVNSLLLLQVK